MGDERCATVGAEIAIRTIRALETRASKTGSQIADLIDAFVGALVARVAGCPYQASGRRLRARFSTQFDSPSNAIAVSHVELRVGAIQILFDKCEHPVVRLMLFAAGTIKQIALLDIGRLAPKDGANF